MRRRKDYFARQTHAYVLNLMSVSLSFSFMVRMIMIFRNRRNPLSPYVARISSSPVRFVIPIVALTVARVVGLQVEAAFLHGGWEDALYPRWSGSDPFNNVMLVAIGYVRSISEGWAFMPAYPTLVRLVMVPWFGFGIGRVETIGDFAWLAAVIVSFVLSTIAMPIFQMIAEHAMTRREALNCTLLMFFFPETFVFSFLGISEALFLLLELSAWVLIQKKKYLASVVSACILSLTDVYGFAISAMLAVVIIRLRRPRMLFYPLLPVIAFVSWLLYVNQASGDWMNVFAPGPYIVDFLSPLMGLQQISLELGQVYLLPLVSSYLIVLVVVFVYFAVRSFAISPEMGTLAISMVVAAIILVPADSLMRALPLVFPIWLNLRVRNSFATVLVVFLMFLMSLVLWAGFISGAFWGV